VAVKFTGQPAEVPRLLEFLQRSVPGFERCRALQTEFRVARRAGTMIVGRYVLTAMMCWPPGSFPTRRRGVAGQSNNGRRRPATNPLPAGGRAL